MEKPETPGSSSTAAQAAMEEGMSLDEFIASGRTGRRNAMPDILDSHKASIGTGQIAFDMEKLNCSENVQQPSQQSSPNPSTSQGS